MCSALPGVTKICMLSKLEDLQLKHFSDTESNNEIITFERSVYASQIFTSTYGLGILRQADMS